MADTPYMLGHANPELARLALQASILDPITERMLRAAGLGRFDMVVGRYVLIHQPDPAAFLRTAAAHVGPGGLLAFHEFMGLGHIVSEGGSPLFQEIGRLVQTAMRVALKHPNVGAHLVEHFDDAGLGRPTLLCEVPVDGGPASPFHDWLALTVRSMMPVIAKVTGASAAALDLDTLADRLRNEASTRRAIATGAPQFLAWVRCGDMVPS